MGLLPSIKTHSLKFETPGTTHTGTLTEIGEEQQATTYETNKPDFWDEDKLRPKMQRKFTLQTDQRDADDPSDDGVRALWAIVNAKPGSIYRAINDALDGANRLGGVLTVTYTGNDPESKNPRNPRKLYTASYVEPPLMGGSQADTAPAATAPAQQQTAPAAAAAPTSSPAAGFTDEQWAGLPDATKTAILAAQGS